MDLFPNRRRFLGLAGTGAAVSVAGCSQLDSASPTDSDGEDDSTDDGDGDGSGETLGTTSTVTAYIQPDQEDLVELQQRQLNLSRQRTELNESEYRAELEQIQQEQLELIEAAIEDFESSVEDMDALAIADSSAQMGMVLLEGTTGALIEALNEGAVDGLFPEATFRGTQPGTLP